MENRGIDITEENKLLREEIKLLKEENYRLKKELNEMSKGYAELYSQAIEKVCAPRDFSTATQDNSTVTKRGRTIENKCEIIKTIDEILLTDFKHIFKQLIKWNDETGMLTKGYCFDDRMWVYQDRIYLDLAKVRKKLNLGDRVILDAIKSYEFGDLSQDENLIYISAVPIWLKLTKKEGYRYKNRRKDKHLELI